MRNFLATLLTLIPGLALADPVLLYNQTTLMQGQISVSVRALCPLSPTTGLQNADVLLRIKTVDGTADYQTCTNNIVGANFITPGAPGAAFTPITIQFYSTLQYAPKVIRSLGYSDCPGDVPNEFGCYFTGNSGVMVDHTITWSGDTDVFRIETGDNVGPYSVYATSTKCKINTRVVQSGGKSYVVLSAAVAAPCPYTLQVYSTSNLFVRGVFPPAS
jgi:hypothetical protein